MPIDLSKLIEAYARYLKAVTDTELPESDRRIDLKHMRFWYPCYADVVLAVARKERPKIERRTLTEINTQSQYDYEHLTDAQILADLDQAHKTLVDNLPLIPKEILIPYRKSTKYSVERYVDTLIDHLRMHWEYLKKQRDT